MKQTINLVLSLACASATVQAQLFDNIGENEAANTPSHSTSDVSSNLATHSTLLKPHERPSNAEQNALIQYMQQSKEIEADFKQITYNQRGEEISTGHMWIAKPSKFFWDYHTPYAQQIISDGRNVYHYDKDLEQITVRSNDELVGDVAIRLLEGQDSLQDEFSISKLNQEDVPSFITVDAKHATVYALTPKMDHSEYNGVWVVLQDNELAQVIVDGGTGQQTIMSFTNLKRNHGISASKFDFKPPQGVDVVGHTAQ